MAQRTEVSLVDDFDGKVANVTATFGWDGDEYEIDLSKRHYEEFAKVIEPYTSAGRLVAKASRPPKKRNRSGRNAKPSLTAVRQWAIDNGYEIGLRGRIPAEILEAYKTAEESKNS